MLEDLLHETSQLLARVSTHTAVVVGPHTSTSATVRSVQLVTLQPSLVLALAILSNGRVEKCILHVAADTDDATVATAGALLDTQLSGARWDALPELRPGRRARRRHARPRGPRRAAAPRARAGARRAALRGWRQPPRRRAGGVPHHRQRGPAARAARAPGRGGLAGARPARPGRHHRAHRIGELHRRAARLLDRRRARTASTARSRAPSACSAPRGWTTARRSPRSRRSPSSSETSWRAQSASMTDYYEVLGHHPQRDRRRDQARVPRAGAPATTPTATPIPSAEAKFKEINVAYETLQDPERRRRYDVFGEEAAPAPAEARPGAGEAFGFGDIFDAFFGGDPFGNRGQAGPAARARRRGGRAPRPRRRPRSAPPRPSTIRLPVACERCEGSGCEPGHAPGALRRVRRRRRGARGPAIDPRPDRHRGTVRRVQRDRQPHPHAVPRVPRRRAGALADGRSTSRCPPVSTTASVCASPVGARPRRAVAFPATSTSPCASRPTRASNARATTSSTCARSRSRRPRWAPTSTSRRSKGSRSSSSRPVRSRGTCSGSRAGACPRCAAAAAATCSCASTSRCPPASRPRRTSSCARSRGPARRGGRERAGQGHVLPAPFRVPVAHRAARDEPPVDRRSRPRSRRDRARVRRAPRRPHHHRRRRRSSPPARPPRAAGRDSHRRRRVRPLARLRRRAPPTGGRGRPGRAHDLVAHEPPLRPRLTVACSLTKGEKPELVGAEAHRARRRPDHARRGRPVGRAVGRRPRSRPRSHRLRAGRARGGDAVAPGAHPGGRRPGRRRPSWPGMPGLVRGRGRRRLRRRPRGCPRTGSGWSRWDRRVASTPTSCGAFGHAPRLAVGPFVLRAETAAIAVAAALAGRAVDFVRSG